MKVIALASTLFDINNTKRIETVIKDGRVIDRRGLEIPANSGTTQ